MTRNRISSDRKDGFTRPTITPRFDPARRRIATFIRGFSIAIALCVLLLVAARSVEAQTETILYSFGSQPGDAIYPFAGLVHDRQGNIYGTTFYGGAHDQGAVFKLTPGGAETVLYSFGSQSGDGIGPSGLILDKDGNLYGTTDAGGAHSLGTVFKLVPNGTETVLYSFGNQTGDGAYPAAGLLLDKQRNLYGTTVWGGSYDLGTVFKLAPEGAETLLYSFGSQPADGANPLAGLVLDKHGNLYGTTNVGGAYEQGTVFKLTPNGTEAVLHSFGSQPGDGGYPSAGLAFDKQGNLYGTTVSGGAQVGGTVFKVASDGSETVLYSFGSQSGDGRSPQAGVVLDKRGNLYGTTLSGGDPFGPGTVFMLTADGTETVLHTFGSQAGDGIDAWSGLAFDKQNNLYGTTAEGGTYGHGTVFKLTP